MFAAGPDPPGVHFQADAVTTADAIHRELMPEFFRKPVSPGSSRKQRKIRYTEKYTTSIPHQTFGKKTRNALIANLPRATGGARIRGPPRITPAEDPHSPSGNPEAARYGTKKFPNSSNRFVQRKTASTSNSFCAKQRTCTPAPPSLRRKKTPKKHSLRPPPQGPSCVISRQTVSLAHACVARWPFLGGPLLDFRMIFEEGGGGAEGGQPFLPVTSSNGASKGLWRPSA